LPALGCLELRCFLEVRHGPANDWPATVRRLPAPTDAATTANAAITADGDADGDARFVVELDGLDGGLASGQYAAFFASDDNNDGGGAWDVCLGSGVMVVGSERQGRWGAAQGR